MSSNHTKAVIRDGGGQVVAAESFYNGPIPPAAEFERYERILPGSADRILKMSENQSKHRHGLEKLVVTIDMVRNLGGLLIGGVIGIGGMVISAYLIMNGKSLEGFVAALVPLASLVTAVIYNKKPPAPPVR